MQHHADSLLLVFWLTLRFHWNHLLQHFIQKYKNNCAWLQCYSLGLHQRWIYNIHTIVSISILLRFALYLKHRTVASYWGICICGYRKANCLEHDTILSLHVRSLRPNIVFVQPLVDLVSSLASIYIKGIQNHLSRWTIIHLFWLIICWFWMSCTWSKTYTNLVMVIMFIYSIYIYLPMSVALKCTYIHVFVLKLSRVITRLKIHSWLSMVILKKWINDLCWP
jgi:hypothetical protein